MAILSVLEFQDHTGEIMVSRIPQDGTAEIIMGSQLIVQDGQLAIFYRDGRPTDGFKAGRYTLSTQNLPIITKLLNFPMYGNKSPFRAYIYFIQLKIFTNLGWGTQTPIIFRDSELKAVSLRAHGSFSIRIGNPNIFLNTIVGSQGLETTFAIEEYIRRIIVSRFANFLPTVLTSVYDIAQRYRDIEIGLKQAVHDDLAQYGLDLVDMLVEAITVPPEVQDMINRAAGSRALSANEMGVYKELAISDAIRDGSKEPNSAFSEMIGIGAGIGIGQQIGASMGNQQAATPPPLSQVPPPIMTSPAIWYVAINNQQSGPYTLESVISYIKSGQVVGSTLMWRQGLPAWSAVGQIAELSPYLTSLMPPPLPTL